MTSFRLASNLRKFDRKRNEWVDAGTNWYTVSTYRQLAINAVGSVFKGDRVLVTGRLRIREWGDGEKRGVNIDLDADALGHDLSWGKSTFTRSIHSAPVQAVAGPTSHESERDGEDEDENSEESHVGDELEPATPF